MGNRAVITTPEHEIAIYLHWNGGRDTIEPLLKYCDYQGWRPPTEDCYGWARLCQVIGNFFGGELSVGIDRFERFGNPGDNGIYVIDGWKIVGREGLPDGFKEAAGHDPDEMLRTFDASMPEHCRLGGLLDAKEVPIDRVRMGDRIWMRNLNGTWGAYPVVGFAMQRASDDDGTKRYERRPYVALYKIYDDYSEYPLNYPTGDEVLVEPRTR